MPRILDLFCGAGGAGMGYHLAGFDIVGVDMNPQPDYPFEFHQADALTFPLDGFDAIHASPPCQRYSTISRMDVEYPDLYEPVRGRLEENGAPWVIENVIGAPYKSGVILCGSQFGMKVRRHRNFESSFFIPQPQCDHKAQGRPYGIYGDGGPCNTSHSMKPRQADFWRYMDMPWMDGKKPYGVAQAIPPAYTHYVGEWLMTHLFGDEIIVR